MIRVLVGQYYGGDAREIDPHAGSAATERADGETGVQQDGDTVGGKGEGVTPASRP
jgi:hypothetical protein